MRIDMQQPGRRSTGMAASRRSALFGLAALVIAACGVGSQAQDAGDRATAPGVRASTPAAETTEAADADRLPPPDADVTVVLYNFHIDGPDAVPAGTEILVTNVGTSPHDWVDEDGTFGTERFGMDEWELVTVDTPGEYTVLCSLHPTSMRATLEVTDGPAPDAGLAADDDTATIELVEYAFVGPDEFAVGTTVTVTNIGRLEHDLVADDGVFGTTVLAPDASEVITLEEAGTFELACTVHPNDMRRTVTVTG